MKLRTEQSFNGRRVRLGDTAIVCTEHCMLDMSLPGNIRAVSVACGAHCSGFENDEPIWCIVGLLSGCPVTVPATMTGRFVERESDLEPGTWTW